MRHVNFKKTPKINLKIRTKLNEYDRTATYADSSAPRKYALTVSVKATARGTWSACPRVRGLGPRDDPYDDVVDPIVAKLFVRSIPDPK